MIYYPEQVMDYIDSITCQECQGYGETYHEYAPDDYEYHKCPDCDNGWMI